MMPISIYTIDSVEYCYYPITKSRIKVRVKATHDARISLRTNLTYDSNVYEITIGGWRNTMSGITKNYQVPDVVEIETIDICGDICDIYIEWSADGVLTVSQEDVPMLMTYKDENPFVINYVGFGTAWGAKGEWTILDDWQFTSQAIRQQLVDTCHLWMDYDCTLNLPLNAAMASEDRLYVGRARHQHSLTPGGIKDETCTLAWKGTAYETKNFQVLCVKDIDWVKSWDGSVPLFALPGGETEDDHALFIGRVLYKGVYYVGKIQPNHQLCYIPINEEEKPFCVYETLVIYNIPYVEHVGR